MEQETAKFVLDVIAGVAGAAWAAGYWYVRRTVAAVATPIEAEAALAQPVPDAVARFKQRLSAIVDGPLGRISVTEVADDGLRWICKRYFRHAGQLRLEGSAPQRAKVRVESETTLYGASVISWVTAPVLIGLYVLLATVVAPSENPTTRMLVLVMLVSVPLLVPPFVIAGIARAMRRRLVGDVTRLTQDLAS